MHVMIHVQHLVGIGHQRRAAVIARALRRHGIEVTYVSGGLPVPELDLGGARPIQLPPARAEDTRYRRLVDPSGTPVDDTWRRARRGACLSVFERARPDVLLVETYPFGRGLLRFELEPLVAAAHARTPRPLVVCSVRDIVEPRDDPARTRRMVEIARRDFDRILVHSDPRVVPLEASLPTAAALASRLDYTGYVSEASDRAGVAALAGVGEGEVLVSAGGGAVGEGLLRAALDARSRAGHLGLRWRLLAGPDLSESVFRSIEETAPDLIVERNRPDFVELLGRCRVSVSQAGYNTMLDLVRARARAVVVPFSGDGEREQSIRAVRFEHRGLVRVVPEARLDGGSLAAAVAAAAAAPRPPPAAVDTDGANGTVRALLAAAP
jgi:predicted glycosyltransferase